MQTSESQSGMLPAVSIMLDHKKRVGPDNRRARRAKLKPLELQELYGKELNAAKNENARRRDLRMRSSMILKPKAIRNA